MTNRSLLQVTSDNDLLDKVVGLVGMIAATPACMATGGSKMDVASVVSLIETVLGIMRAVGDRPFVTMYVYGGPYRHSTLHNLCLEVAGLCLGGGLSSSIPCYPL